LGFAPIQEIAEGRNTCIKEFYWKLWHGDDAILPDINIHDLFTGPEVTIESSTVEQFCAVVGIQEEYFKVAWTTEVKALWTSQYSSDWVAGESSFISRTSISS
jgi:fatty acid synthase subunit alpha, fungi type